MTRLLGTHSAERSEAPAPSVARGGNGLIFDRFSGLADQFENEMPPLVFTFIVGTYILIFISYLVFLTNPSFGISALMALDVYNLYSSPYINDQLFKVVGKLVVIGVIIGYNSFYLLLNGQNFVSMDRKTKKKYGATLFMVSIIINLIPMSLLIKKYHSAGLLEFTNDCKCKHGKPYNYCSTTAKSSCADCDTSIIFKVEEDTYCSLRKCLCSDGIPTTGIDCPSEFTKKCVSCNDGYDLQADFTCKLRECTCLGGTPAIGIDCPSEFTEKCVSCMEGYYFQTDFICKLRKCTCSDGTPATGIDCPSKFTKKCASCNVGYDLQADFTCKLRECTCPGGTPAIGIDCPSEFADQCVSCIDGYDLHTDFTCKLRECTCSDGTPATGIECTLGFIYYWDNIEKCVSCNDGYNLLTDFTCKLRECTCFGGVPKTGVDCPIDGEELCQSCFDYYYLYDEKCSDLYSYTYTYVPYFIHSNIFENIKFDNAMLLRVLVYE